MKKHTPENTEIVYLEGVKRVGGLLFLLMELAETKKLDKKKKKT